MPMGSNSGMSKPSCSATYLIPFQNPSSHFLKFNATPFLSPVSRKLPTISIKQRRNFSSLTQIVMASSSISASVGSPREILEGSSSEKAGANDLMIVGPGVLGRLMAENGERNIQDVKSLGEQ